MSYAELDNWIAGGQSYRAYVEYGVGDRTPNFPAVGRSNEFYISLMGELFEALDSVDTDATTLVTLARGLELYSHHSTKARFSGVEPSRNLLYAAALYYWAGYTASAYILSATTHIDSPSNPEQILHAVLSRSIKGMRVANPNLARYLEHGAPENAIAVVQTVCTQHDLWANQEPTDALAIGLLRRVLGVFAERVIWSALPDRPDGFWRPLVDRWLERPIWEFFPGQRLAIQAGVLGAAQTVSLQLPTSGGKTSLSEIIAYDVLRSNPAAKILLLAPFRALAVELRDGLCVRLEGHGIATRCLYGGNSIAAEMEELHDARFVVSTPEKLLALENSHPEIYDDYGVVICDEGHLLDDSERGLSYELLLTILKRPRRDSTIRRFVFLSAIIPNIKDINTWLGGSDQTVVQTRDRPTEIEYCVLERERKNREGKQTSYDLVVNPFHAQPRSYRVFGILKKEDFTFKNTKTRRSNTHAYIESYKPLAIALARRALTEGSVAVFSANKHGDQGISALGQELLTQLEQNLPLPLPSQHANTERCAALAEYFGAVFGATSTIARTAANAALIHHGDLPQFTRELIERAFRQKWAPVVFCTSTLAEGVNLPVKTLILYKITRYDPDDKKSKPLPVRALKNLVGRAGRAGHDTLGRVVAVNSGDKSQIRQMFLDAPGAPAVGPLLRIARAIVAAQLKITNVILEAQREEILKLVDAIDVSLIDLLAEETPLDQLESMVTSLAKETFAYSQADQPGRDSVTELLKVRGDRLRGFFQRGEFSQMKESGLSVRKFEQALKTTDFDAAIWDELTDPADEDWIAFILSTIATYPDFASALTAFKEEHPTATLDIASVLRAWLSGESYSAIAVGAGLDVEGVLSLFVSVIGFGLSTSAAAATRIAGIRLKSMNRKLTQTVEDWGSYLDYGIRHSWQLHLVREGLGDRLALWALAPWVQAQEALGSDAESLFRFRPLDALASLDGRVPRLTMERAREVMEGLDGEWH